MRPRMFSRMGVLLACALALTVAYKGMALGASQSSGDRIVRVVTLSQDGLEFGANPGRGDPCGLQVDALALSGENAVHDGRCSSCCARVIHIIACDGASMGHPRRRYSPWWLHDRGVEGLAVEGGLSCTEQHLHA